MNHSRRRFLAMASAAAGSCLLPCESLPGDEPAQFQLRYMLPSCMYGYTDLKEILPEAQKIGATAIDLWPMVHGNQREQLDELGEEKFAALLKSHNVTLGCLTQYKLGPFGLQDEMRLAERLGCSTIVTGDPGPKGLKGVELKKKVAEFVEQLKPHLEVAAETGVTVVIENHSGKMIDTPDALRYLLDLRPSHNFGIALAPYHLPQDPELLGQLIREMGNVLRVFYAWDHGKGAMSKLPKDEELQQLPGRGPLDFGPLVAALREIRFDGWTEVFMHPFPRGIAIHETTSQVTEEINRSRSYLDSLLAKKN
jgi:sugar phosphate isomerase/epimerase